MQNNSRKIGITQKWKENQFLNNSVICPTPSPKVCIHLDMTYIQETDVFQSDSSRVCYIK